MTQSPQPESLRLNKYLAFHLGVSRREADELIDKGRVTINGEVAAIGRRITESDSISVNGKPIIKQVKPTYILFHKPVGYVCSRKNQGDNPTIYNIIPADFHRLKTVGRLDKDSSGVILLTDDGDLTLKLTHPRYSKQKIYEVMLDRDLEPLHQQMISDYGVVLDDGPSKMQLERLSDSSRKPWRVIMSEGRNRQIRRTFAAIGYTVIKLHRTNFGEYALGDIKPGEYEIIDIHSVI